MKIFNLLIHPVEVTVSKVTGSLTVDGRLDEADWQNSQVISEFFRREPRQGGTIRYQTEVRFLYEDKNIYIGAFCKDSVGVSGIRIQDLRHDFSWGLNDIFEIHLTLKI